MPSRRTCPERGWRVEGSRALTLADVQFELPSIRAVTGDAPQFQGADFGDSTLERDGDRAVAAAVSGQRDFQRAHLLEIVAPVFDERPDGVSLAGGGTEEPEFRRLSCRINLKYFIELRAPAAEVLKDQESARPRYRSW